MIKSIRREIGIFLIALGIKILDDQTLQFFVKDLKKMTRDQ